MHPGWRSTGSLLLALFAFACAKSVETPVAAVATPAAANVGSVVQLDGTTSSDPQGRSLAYDWTMLELPAGSSAKLNDAHIATPSFVADVAGTYRLQLVVSNSFVSSAPMEVKVTVNGCGANAPVVQTTHASPTSPNPGQQVTLIAPISDADTACVPNIPNQVWTYTWTMTSRPAGSSAFIGTPSGLLTSLSTPATATFNPDVPGAYSFQVTATDVTQRQSAPAFLTVIATSCGFGVPSVSLASNAISGTPGVQSTLPAAVVSDPDSAAGCGLQQNDSYLWTLISRPAASSATLLDPTVAAPTFTPDHGGAYSFQVAVTDSTGLTSAPAFVTLTATACDQAAPSVTSISAGAAVIGTAVALSAQVTDANCLATARTYAWSLTSRPAGSSAALSNPAAAAPSFTPDVAGDYQVSLTVHNDQGFSSAPAFTTVTAAGCTVSGPVFGNPAVTATDLDNPSQTDVGDRLALSASASEANTCGSIPLTPFSYRWQLISRPQGSQAALSSATDAQPIFVPDVQGSYQLSVIVADRLGNAAPAALLTVTTSTCGANPIVADFTDASGARAFDAHQLTATASSADDDPARCPARFRQTYAASWSVVSSAPNAGHLFQNASGLSTAFSPGGNGTFDVQLTVTGSNSGRTAVVHKQIAVMCMNLAPVITGVSIASNTPGFAPGEIFRDDVATLFAQAASECFTAPVFSYFWTLTPPAGSASSLSSAFAAAPVFAVDRPAATWTATVFVRDSLGNASAVAAQAFTSSSCGINPVSVAVNAIPGAKPFDTVDLSAVAVSADDSAACPARFHNPTYAFVWSLTSGPTANFLLGTGTTAANASTDTFLPGDNGDWHITAQATGSVSHTSGSGNTTVSVLCSDTPLLGIIAASGASNPHLGDTGGDFNRGDTIALSVPVDVSSCYSTPSSAGLQYAWTMTGSTLAPVASPTFTAAQASTSYAPRVTVADKWGHAASAGPAPFASSSCGQSAVSIHTPLSDTFAGKDFDPHTIVAVASSRDDDSAFCPASFANSGYSYAFSLVNPPNTKFSLAGAGGTATLALGESPATYTLRTTATGDTSNVTSAAVDTIFTTTCSPTPLVQNPSVASGASSPHAGGDFNRGDTVTLTAPADVSACYSSASTAGLSWSWSLSPTAGDTAQFPALVGATTPSPSFTVDQASRIYIAAATATDKWGHANAPASTSFTSSNCGNNPITATIANAPGAKPMDAATLTATASTLDANPASCPASFAPVFAYAWTVSPSDGSSFSDATAGSTSFTPKAPTQYTATVVVSAKAPATSPASGPVNTLVDATCAAPSVGAIQFTDITNSGTTYFSGDSITASAASVTSSCKSAPTFTYTWTVNPGPITGTAATQTFAAAGFNTAYTAQLDVTDDSGQTSSSTGTLTTSGCGSAAPVVSFVSAAQHFDTINQQRPTDATPSPQALDLAASASAPEAQVTIGSDQFPVSFYLAAQMSATVRVDDATNAACSSGYELTGAKLFGPNGVEVLTPDFTPPANATVASGGTLDFSFTPRIGDVTTPSFVPGNYTLVASFRYGAPSGLTQSDVTANAIHIGGRCGLNAPFADFTLTPPSLAVGTLETADASTSSDADNDPLILGLGTPNFSTGCGLAQTLSYAWVLTPPASSTTAALSSATGVTTSFTPDVAGNYTLQLTVDDGTGTPTSTFTTTATAP